MYISAWYQWCLLWYWKPIPGCDQCALQSGKTRKGKETTVWWFIAQDPLPKLPRSKCCHSVGPQQSMNPKWNRKEMGVGPKMSRFYLNTPNQTLWLDHSIQVVPFKIVICFPFVRTSTRKSLVLWWWRNITVQGSPWLASRDFYPFHLTQLIATTCICSIKSGAHTHTHIYTYIYIHTYLHTYIYIHIYIFTIDTHIWSSQAFGWYLHFFSSILERIGVVAPPTAELRAAAQHGQISVEAGS